MRCGAAVRGQLRALLRPGWEEPSAQPINKKIYKLLDSAVANVQSSDLDWDLDELYVTRAFVDEGPTMRRFQPRAMGRATRIRKRTSHITLELGQN